MSELYECRRDAFKLTLDLHDGNFIFTPRSSQRSWHIHRSLEELGEDLEHLHGITQRFVRGSERSEIPLDGDWSDHEAEYGDTELVIQRQQVMQDWERPYMKAMAEVVAESGGDILEVGFGMGISADFIQEQGVRSHTIIECNADVLRHAEEFRHRHRGSEINLVPGRWQDVIESLGTFDGIFFDCYPMNEDEFCEFVVEDVTFASCFFEAAARHLRPGGVFTYYSNEIDSVSRRHQRRIFECFSNVRFHVVDSLDPTSDCNYWWADSMVVVAAIK